MPGEYVEIGDKRKAEDDEPHSVTTVHLDKMQCVDRPQLVDGFEEIAVWGDDKKIRVGKSISPSFGEPIINVIK